MSRKAKGGVLGLYALVEKALTDRCSTTERLNAAVVERLDREYQREFERAGNAHWETCKFVALRGDRLLERQVRETPSWPRRWANFSLFQLYSNRNAWADRHLLGQPDTAHAAAAGGAAEPGELRPEGPARRRRGADPPALRYKSL